MNLRPLLIPLLVLVPGLAVLVLFTPLGCTWGVHWQKRQAFVGDSWNPDLHVRVCRWCGEEA